MAEVDTRPSEDSGASAPPVIVPSQDPVEQELPAETTETALTTTDGAKKKVVKKIVKKKRRPARAQVDPATFKTEPPPQTGTIFNIWYNKWSGGDREDKFLSKHAAPSRCNIARDSGYTRADSVPGSYFCLFFARGLCPHGRECQYLHRLPTVHDLFNPNVDCFGRDKFSDYRDDMGGVGSFMRQNRTLYVGRIHVTDDIEEVVARHFQEWGQIERIRVLTARGVAFVTYTNEANSQFAKEAMAHQSLDNNEVLNVRWATVDPNPQAQKREAHRLEEQAAEAIRRALPAEFVAEIEGRDPEQSKRRKVEGSFGLEGYQAPDEVWYAREKARQLEGGGQAAQLEGPEERLMIEGPAGQEAQGLLEQQPQQHQQEESPPKKEEGGILAGWTPPAGIMFTTVKKAEKPQGPLVAYGSDDESD